MLKTRAMFLHKDQAMSQSVDLQSDPMGHNNSTTKGITNPLTLSLLIGLNNKMCISDSDFVRSPKSPLEFRVLSTLGADPFCLRSPKSSLTAHLNCGCVPSAKVGLSIVHSLGDDRCLSPDVVFGPALRIKSSEIVDQHSKLSHETKSMKMEKERSGVVFEISDNSFETEPVGLRNRSFSANDCLPKTLVLSGSKLGAEEDDFTGSGSDTAISCCLSDDDMEDYTCITAHGPNPKTTHIYGDRVLECDKNVLKRDDGNKEKPTETPFLPMFPSDNFLNICNFCNKKLDISDDIYMYREKAFCSEECRSEEMITDEDLEEDSSITMNESLKLF